jgi:hypothetical protein
MKKQAQKIWNKPVEIRMEIVKLRRKAIKLEKEAKEYDEKIKEWMRLANASGTLPGQRAICRENADADRKKAIKLRRTCQLIEENKIPQLTRTLSALQTKPMAFMDTEGVPLQK